jgi:hypothetical protein
MSNRAGELLLAAGDNGVLPISVLFVHWRSLV